MKKQSIDQRLWVTPLSAFSRPLFIWMGLVFGTLSGLAQTATVSTIPEGFTTFNLAATGAGVNLTTYFSVPLSNDPVYTGAVSALTASTITIADSPAPWTASQFVASPYFVKFLSGGQAGRVILVTANTSNTLTLDTTDHSSQTVDLTTSGFSVAAGDIFEVFAGDTLASAFGVNTTQSPLILVGGTGILNSDTVSIYNAALIRFQAFYFDTNAGFWKMSGSSANANNTILYPYSAFAVTRRGSEPATSFVLMGRAAEVTRLIKTPGNNAIVYDSTGYPVDLTLSQLQLGANWTQGASVLSADTVSVWNATLVRFDTYFQMTDSTWRKSGGGTTDQSSFVIPAGTTVGFLKRAAVSGSTSYLQPVLPYTP